MPANKTFWNCSEKLKTTMKAALQKGQISKKLKKQQNEKSNIFCDRYYFPTQRFLPGK